MDGRKTQWHSPMQIALSCIDGGGRHPVNDNLAQIEELAKKGVGIVCIHYGVESQRRIGKSFSRLDWRVFRDSLVCKSTLDG